MTKIIFVRHAKPMKGGADRERPLTEEGFADSALVLETLKDKKIDAFYSSPYKRSVQTIQSTADHFGAKIEIDERLHERISGGVWNSREKLLRRWKEFEYHEECGESLGSVQRRNIAALNDILCRHEGECVVIGTHGTALSTIFNYYDPSFGIDDFFRIVNLMPYIVECDFDAGRLVGKTELAWIDKTDRKTFEKNCSSGAPELWDAYDRNLDKIEGVTLTRGEKIPDGLFHLVAEVIVKHTEGEYLLMQRDPRKHYGGMWEATAGGSALAGETAFDCAKRELYEETGILTSDLVRVGHVASEENRTIYAEYFCVTDHDKQSVVLQEGETSAYKWVTKDELLAMDRDRLVTKRMQTFIEELKG